MTFFFFPRFSLLCMFESMKLMSFTKTFRFLDFGLDGDFDGSRKSFYFASRIWTISTSIIQTLGFHDFHFDWNSNLFKKNRFHRKYYYYLFDVVVAVVFCRMISSFCNSFGVFYYGRYCCYCCCYYCSNLKNNSNFLHQKFRSKFDSFFFL